MLRARSHEVEKLLECIVGGSEIRLRAETMTCQKLTNVPYWASDSLKQKIYQAATAYGEDLKLDKDAALSVQQRNGIGRSLDFSYA